MTVSKWAPDRALVVELDGLFARAIDSYRANPNLITEHANHEESIRVGGYANRSLLELVQNAADAMTGMQSIGGTDGRVEIVLDLSTNTLYCANTGRPFSVNGLTALAHAHLSGKRGDEIGRFGLGFKSVLAVTEKPQVFSRSISFEFNSIEANRVLSDIGSVTRRLPVLRTATRIHDVDGEFAEDPILDELAQWAATIVKLPNVRKLASLQKEIEGFRSEFLLFVEAVREVHLRIVGPGGGFATSHISRTLGDGKFQIERPDGKDSFWYVESEMHSPSPEARREVGEAVSRDRVKVTVAVPERYADLQTGEFWSYFPLQDKTTASALLNAPWSVNDDRTTLLRNKYNREIAMTLAKMFVSLLPRVVQADDLGAHLDYMPARGREALSFGDDLLSTHVPRLAARSSLVPDGQGRLCTPDELIPLSFSVLDETSRDRVTSRDHEAWINSPNTGDDVPHWRCYSTPRRFARLRQMYIYSVDLAQIEVQGRDESKALEQVRTRGILSWLREWSTGDMRSAAAALAFVLVHPKIEGIQKANVIPTTEGLRSLGDRAHVFLAQVDDIEFEGASFVLPEFLAIGGVEKNLRERGFRDLDPVAILHARIDRLSSSSGAEDQEKFWDAVMDVRPEEAARIVQKRNSGFLAVPTADGGWAPPRSVFDIDGLSNGLDNRRLDRRRCVPRVARAAGVIYEPTRDYPLEDEVLVGRYHDFVLADLNTRLGPGERPVENIEFDQYLGPGPFSALLLMAEAGVVDSTRADWTYKLLEIDEKPLWTCEDVDTQQAKQIQSPVRWAVGETGLVSSSRGLRPPSQVVSASLLEFQDFLPLYQGPRSIEDKLDLPRNLVDVPAEVLREALGQDIFKPGVRDAVLTAFVLQASKIAYAESHPQRIPARVGRAIEGRKPGMVYLATNDEQRVLLSQKQKPYLCVAETDVEEVVVHIGCKRFEDSFAFSTIIEGRQEPDAVVDIYPGLQESWLFVHEKLSHARVSRALYIAKRVTTDGGVGEDEALPWLLDGLTLIVPNHLNDRQVLETVNEAFELRLSNADLNNVEQVTLDHQLEECRQQAKAAKDDTERLEVFFGRDTLKDKLPQGLWQALEAQGLVDDSSSVADLFLTVHGGDSVKVLADDFRSEGYTDVPTLWAGGGQTIDWLRKMGFGAKYAGRRAERQPYEFIVPGAVNLNGLHTYQKKISEKLRTVLTQPSDKGPAQKGMVELPTGAGKTRVATETVLKLFKDEVMSGTVLWIAQSVELCEQAVQTFNTVWRYLADDRPLSIGRLWEHNIIHEPETEVSVVVATDAKLEAVLNQPEYQWLRHAQAVFVDEAHRAGNSKRYTEIFRWLGVDGHNWERPLVGLSATPFKGRAEDGQKTKELAARFGNNKLVAFESDAYRQLQKLEVLASVKHEVLPGVDIKLSREELRGIQDNRMIDRPLLERLGRDQARMKVLVDHILAQDSDWSILVFTPSVLSAQVLAATLRYQGVESAAISGQTGRQERRDVIKRFKDEEIRVLTNCDLLVQGFDAPGVRALYIARPTFSPSSYIQMAGRGLRGPENGGKGECLIVDVADNFGAVNDFLGYREYEDLWKEQNA